MKFNKDLSIPTHKREGWFYILILLIGNALLNMFIGPYSFAISLTLNLIGTVLLICFIIEIIANITGKNRPLEKE